jgi:hypothetical protein
LLRKELSIAIRTLGPTFPDTLAAMENLAGTLAYEGRGDESIALYKKALNSSSQAEQVNQMQAHVTFASGLSILGRPAESFQQGEEAIKLGFTDADQLANDDDFKALRTRFNVCATYSHGSMKFETVTSRKRNRANTRPARLQPGNTASVVP